MYSIGETARLTGVSVQTLRLYDKWGIIKPAYVNPENGYRFYLDNQFHKIDRVKYLQKLDIRLESIRRILETGDVSDLLAQLVTQRAHLEAEHQRIGEAIKDLDWYMGYFTYANEQYEAPRFYELDLPERYGLWVSCEGCESLSEMELRLAELKNAPKHRHLPYLRQYGYVLEPKALSEGVFKPLKYFIYVKERPESFDANTWLTIPAGRALCTTGKILKQDWDVVGLNEAIAARGVPRLMIANEFEDNLIEFSNATYEIQVQF